MRSSRSTPIVALGRLLVASCMVAAVVVAATPALAAGTITAFTLDGERGDYIGGGQTLTYTAEDATITASGAGTINMTAIQGGYDHWWYATLAPPTGQAFSPGVTYPTTRFASDSTAGLDVSGDGRGCNSSTGSLEVLEVSFAADGVVDAFAATYEQHCEGATPALFGELRYQSSVDFEAVSVDPTYIDFGSQASVPSDPRSVTITNTGSTSLDLGAATFTGAQAPDFSATSDSCSGASLSTGGTCTLAVVFTPSDSGARAASLELPVSTARGAAEIFLDGNGILLQTAVKLATSAQKVTFGRSVTITAHLADHETSLSTQLMIYATPYGGAKKLVASGDVNGSGDLSVRMKLTKRTSFVARFPGDGVYGSATSPSKTVYVYPVVKGALIRYDSTSGRYRLYRYTPQCPNARKGCPTYVVSLSPRHAGDTVRVTLQVHVGGSWRTAVTSKLKLNAKSKAGIVFVYRDRSIIGVATRVRAGFNGDGDHLEKTSSWSYLRVTS